MKTRTTKIQPFRAQDGDTAALLEFARRVLPAIDSRFETSLQEQPVVKKTEPYDYDLTTILFGDENLGIRVTYKIGYEPRYAGHAEDRVILVVLGLPSEMKFELECTRYYYDPRFLEIRLSLFEDKLEQIIQEFKDHFRQDSDMTQEEIEKACRSIRSALANRAWSSAEKYARSILRTDSMNAYALFGLGLALAGQGLEDEAEEYLEKSVELDPTNFDALYNLAIVYMKRDDHEKSIALLTRGLQYDVENHPILYQLARVYEKMGDESKAIEYYERAVETSPNPGGHFHYTGLDFTQLAEESLRRLK